MKAKIIIPASVISVLLANAPSSYAHDFPSKPVRIVVPFPPGGSADTVTRMLGQSLCERWKQPVVIENKAGASGMIGTSQVARSSADGYTLVMASGGSQAINVGLFNKISYDPIKDFSPVSLTAIFPLLMVSPANAPYSSVKEFIKWAKSQLLLHWARVSLAPRRGAVHRQHEARPDAHPLQGKWSCPGGCNRRILERHI